jgi:hypothetical protein
MDVVKKCSQCNEVKPLSEFYVITQRGKPYVKASCKQCNTISKRHWTRANRERLLERCRNWRQKNRKLSVQIATRWVKNNKERRQEYYRGYYERNLEKIRAQALRWAKDHPHVVNAKSKARKFRTRTPAWANPVYISDMYMLAKLVSEFTGDKYHVDHIVPITSSVVCGLHVEHNLQVMKQADNIRKRNIHWPDMP